VLVLTDQNQVTNLTAINRVKTAKIGAYRVLVVREIRHHAKTAISLVETILLEIVVAAVVLVIGMTEVGEIDLVITEMTDPHLLEISPATTEMTDPHPLEIDASPIAVVPVSLRSGKIEQAIAATIVVAGKILPPQKSPKKRSAITSMVSIRSSLRSKKNAKSTRSGCSPNCATIHPSSR
jgi:hypothetical protein